MNALRIIGASLAFLSCGNAAAEPYRFTEACDGSAVVGVGDGYFLDATDEDNLIRLYRMGSPEPVKSFALDDFLQTELNKRGRRKEADIEAVAKVGNRLYWIGSHSRDRKGDLERSRFRFFATELTGSGANVKIAEVGRPYDGLLASLAKLDTHVASALKSAEAPPPSEGGINIEGLAAWTGDGILIGFRSPLIDGKALLVPMLNPAGVIDKNKKEEPSFGAPILLDLGGLGIRAIEPKGQGARDSYWILAGPVKASDQSRLYEWTLGGQPVQSKVSLPAETTGSGEGLMVDSTGKLFASLDGGDVGDPVCKDSPLDMRSFVVVAIDE
jgi:hypothetical protein